MWAFRFSVGKIYLSFFFFFSIFFPKSTWLHDQIEIVLGKKPNACYLLVADSFWQIQLVAYVPNAASTSLPMPESIQLYAIVTKCDVLHAVGHWLF